MRAQFIQLKNLAWLKLSFLVLFVLAVLSIVFLPRVWAASPVENLDFDENKTQKMVTIFDHQIKKVVLSDQSTVEQVLMQAKVELGDHDLIEPSLDSEISSDNFNINIFRARPVVIVDGSRRLSVMSPYQVPEQIVRGAGLELFAEDEILTGFNFLATGPNTGVEYVVKRAKQINFIYYGEQALLRTQKTTVAEFLDEKKLTLAENDRLSLSLDAELSDQLRLELWREGKQEISVEEEIAFKTRQIYDYNQNSSYRKIENPGQNGKKIVTYEIEIKNGVEVARREISSLVTVAPVEQVEVHGAKGRYNSPSENENITWDFLIKQGFSRVQAAGIMGNLMQEHRFQTSDAPGGLGIVQWIGGRRAELMKRYPDAWDTIDAQLEFLIYELNSGYAHVKRALLATDDLKTAVDIFQNQFEKCGICRNEKRVEYAANILASH